MYHLRLSKGKSYWGVVRATEKEPDVYIEEKDRADYLVRSGYFVLVDESEKGETKRKEPGGEAGPEENDFFSDEPLEEAQEKPIIVELQAMTKAELSEYAEKNGIEITGCKTKDDIFQKIIDAIARAEDARAALRK